MSLVYSEEQRLLADTARDFLAARSPVSAQRRLRDEGRAHARRWLEQHRSSIGRNSSLDLANVFY